MIRLILLLMVTVCLSACSGEQSQIDKDIENLDKQIVNLEQRISELNNENELLTEKKNQKQEQLTELERKAKEDSK
ncbi:FlxA-like family protein [Phocicoccus pinnipedialis]|uniref:Uncharacterized protein n=1 Tax=Phocicoccus pinnipedialis TaxID=110845 RepID=A0A6V7QZU9_9BACL|nr:FlxA-like family protein [Jeotgalicoccus pinnipedialis]MBP1938732.1 putative nucleic acid-binding Zn-ribbon protein [Jeotgalicoccus pinnipedialis]CAD2070560.1 hypothetical protein JEOPIN946_00042 [Jeotgalicoccus pinnipedialis]